ncbi:hypothetical protein CBG25_20255 [Arsenophonus sp. ENCA]|uniref:ParB/RepB/Spo0J family partition protein n=1 Tax=Arsenophonus sp. ENCA TaxID=1987579 RepID=UPI000BD86C8B|nr:hypothetical protein [Arsenophonus sp. ENCA]PAU99248.1 hypothetical protein CBG25_20255 [Arsenophonus sp. ENCA]
MKNNTQATENKLNKDTIVAMNKDTEATKTKVTTDETTIIPLKKYASSHKESVSNASSIFNVPPDSLYIEEGFNLRDIDEEHARNFLKSYQSGVYVPPLSVKVILVDGEQRLKIIDGHHRYLALQMAKAAGVDIGFVPVSEFIGSVQDEVINMITSAEGKPLTPLEKAEGFYRLMNWGWNKKQISKKTGNTLVTIERLLRLYRCGDANITQLVKSNLITADLAIEIIVECEGNGKNAYDVMMKGLQKAQATGKSKITRRSVPSKNKVPFTKKELVSCFSSLSAIQNEVENALNSVDEKEEKVSLIVPKEVLTLLNDVLTKWEQSARETEEKEEEVASAVPADTGEAVIVLSDDASEGVIKLSGDTELEVPNQPNDAKEQ